MRFGAPQRTRCPSTGRVQHLYMESDNGGEEIFLTRLNEALNEGPKAIKAMRVELSDGSEFALIFPHCESDAEPGTDMNQSLVDAAKIHAEAVKIIALALEECSHPTLTRKDHDGNARAILARLAHANLLIDRH